MRGEWERPILTVDVVLLTLEDRMLMTALQARPAEPFEGREALIGGYVRPDEDESAEATAARVLRDKAGLSGVFIEQLRTFSGPKRDPRGWSASVAYLALVPAETLRTAGSNGLVLRPAERPGALPFDHDQIVEAAVGRLRSKGAYSTLPARLLPDAFTLSELKGVYEVAMGERLDPSSFRRKIAELDLLRELPGEARKSSTVRRPAQLYSLRDAVSVFDRRL